MIGGCVKMSQKIIDYDGVVLVLYLLLLLLLLRATSFN
jgi:hypothetical protein